MPILGDFAAKYGARGQELGVPMDDLYQALVDNAENTVSAIAPMCSGSCAHDRPRSLPTGIELAGRTLPGRRLATSPLLGSILPAPLACLHVKPPGLWRSVSLGTNVDIVLTIFWQYALGDFAVRQTGLVLNKPADEVAKYTNRSMNFVNHWDPNLVHDGFKGFAQRRYAVRNPPLVWSR